MPEIRTQLCASLLKKVSELLLHPSLKSFRIHRHRRPENSHNTAPGCVVHVSEVWEWRFTTSSAIRLEEVLICRMLRHTLLCSLMRYHTTRPRYHRP